MIVKTKCVITTTAPACATAKADYELQPTSDLDAGCTGIETGSGLCAMALVVAGGDDADIAGKYCLPQSFFNDATGDLGEEINLANGDPMGLTGNVKLKAAEKCK